MRRIAIGLSVVLVALLASCSQGSRADVCSLSENLVPSCGVMWGVSTQPASMDGVESVEKVVGRDFDMVYRYHDLAQSIPDDFDRGAVAQGRVLHLAIAARVYTDDTTVAYKDVANGKYDATLSAQGAGIASLKVPVFVTFEQEANQLRKLGVRGDAADFIAAWRHIRQVYREAGATNAIWVWVMMGASDKLDRAASLWPGNDVVDWISWNVYNSSGCQSGQIKPDKYETVEVALRPFYDWVHAKGPSLGIDPRKPMMISEAGSVHYSENPGLTADWYGQVPGVLAKHPQIKAFTLWASRTSPACDYRFWDDSVVSAAVAKSAQQSPFTSTIMPLRPGG